MKRSTWPIIRDVVTTGAVVVVAAAVLWSVWSERRPIAGNADVSAGAVNARETPPATVPLTEAAFKGAQRAEVAMVVFSDFECPYCARFVRDILPELDERYIRTGKVLYVHRHLPLVSIHPLAQKAAEASECAALQGQFWALHDRLFLAPRLTEVVLRGAVETLGLDQAQFSACMSRGMAGRVRADGALAARFAVTGTPAFLIGLVRQGGQLEVLQRLNGAQPVARFEAILDDLLTRSESN